MTGGGPIEAEGGERFVLYENDADFGVLDRAVPPQIYFAETRARAVAEVARANEIVAVFPTTISMRHLREMDGTWRDARGLSRLPEPEGRRLVIHAMLPVGGGPARTEAGAPRTGATSQAAASSVPETGPQSGSGIERTLAAAAEAAALEALRQRVQAACAHLARTRSLADEIAGLTSAAEEPMIQFRAAFRDLYGDHAGAAEEGFGTVLRTDGAQQAVGLVLDDPRALLPSPRPRVIPGGLDARERAAAAASSVATLMTRLDRAAEAGRRQAGMSVGDDGDDASQRAAVQARLLELTPVHEGAIAAALEVYGYAQASSPPEAALRHEWSMLSAAERDMVRSAVPNLVELLGRGQTPGRNTGRENTSGL